MLWVGSADPAGPAPRAVWHVWHDGAVYVLTGGPEQPLPGVRPGGRAVVVGRSSRGDRVVQWPAQVQVVAPGTAAWDAVVPLLQARRLNAADRAARPARWAQECTLLRLRPDGGALLPAGQATQTRQAGQTTQAGQAGQATQAGQAGQRAGADR